MKHVNLRLPDEVHAALAAMAAEERRSLNSMIVALIEQEAKRRPRRRLNRAANPGPTGEPS